MKIFILIILFSIQAQSFNKTFDSHEELDWDSMKAVILARPQSVASLEQALSALQKMRSARSLCESQLTRVRIPISCFELLDLERKLNWVKGKQGSENFEQIDSFCVRVLRKIETLSDDQLRLKLPRSKCQKAMQEHIEKLRYGATFRDPLEVFSLRHRF